jgi:hypothetical protein
MSIQRKALVKTKEQITAERNTAISSQDSLRLKVENLEQEAALLKKDQNQLAVTHKDAVTDLIIEKSVAITDAHTAKASVAAYQGAESDLVKKLLEKEGMVTCLIDGTAKCQMEIADLKDEIKLYKEDGGVNGLGHVSWMLASNKDVLDK